MYISLGFVPLRGLGLGTDALCLGDLRNAWYFQASDICLIWKNKETEQNQKDKNETAGIREKRSSVLEGRVTGRETESQGDGVSITRVVDEEA